MYLLRTNVSTKLIDNEGYLEALFGYDPDPQTRPDYRTEALKEEFAQAAQNPLADKARYVRCHRLSSLRGSPGRSDTWTEEYYNAFREAQLEYGYGIYKGSEDGVCLLRYSKLNPDGISITTKIVFADPQFWYDNVEPHYMKLEPLLILILNLKRKKFKSRYLQKLQRSALISPPNLAIGMSSIHTPDSKSA